MLFKYTPTLLVVKLGKKKTGTWVAGYSNPNLVRRRGSGIFPVLTRLYGWFSLVYGWGGHWQCNVPFWFQCHLQSALHRGWNVWCWLTPGQTCHWSESRSQHGNCSWKTTTHKHNNTIKMKNKRTNVNMQAQEVSRGWRWDQENFLTALADQWFQPT